MNETSNFCGYCGKPLVDGKCDCREKKPAPPDTKKIEKKESSRHNILYYFKNPIGASIQFNDNSNPIIPFITAVVHLIIVYAVLFLMTGVNNIALIGTMMTAVAIISYVLFSFLFGRFVLGTRASLSTYTAKFCIATIIPSFFLILTCTGYFLLWPFCIVFLALTVTSWGIVSVMFLKELYDVKESVVFWAFMVISLITTLILIALGVVFHNQIIQIISNTNLIDLFI